MVILQPVFCIFPVFNVKKMPHFIEKSLFLNDPNEAKLSLSTQFFMDPFRIQIIYAHSYITDRSSSSMLLHNIVFEISSISMYPHSKNFYFRTQIQELQPVSSSAQESLWIQIHNTVMSKGNVNAI